MQSMAAAGFAASSSTDRLSQLSDDILTHILSFAPSREAARATALSRRWCRPLWLETGTVNVDYRSYSTDGGVPIRRRVVDDADHAYACLCSRGRVPKKLSIVMPCDAIVCTACDHEDNSAGVEDEVSGGVEEEYEDEFDDGDELEDEEAAVDADHVEDPWLDWLDNGGLPRCSLPFAVLRVLELTGYDLEPYSAGRRQLAFPRLEAMRLRRCRTEVDTLQTIISAAPRLADIRLESLVFVDQHHEYRLSCKAATVIVMENCVRLRDRLGHSSYTVTLNAPRLRQFRYAHAGVLGEHTSVSFKRPLQHLEELHVAVHAASSDAAYLRGRILGNARHTRYLKLTAYSIADLGDDDLQDLPSLERLDIEELCGWCVGSHGAAAKAMASLLRKCPVVRDLRIKFSWRKYLREINADPADEMAAIADFSPCGSIAADDDDDEGDCCDSLEDLHEQFCCRCKLRCLRRVVVEFDAEELTCFQVRLVKFLAKSAVGLEEFVVDGGKGYDSSCIDRKVARWRKPRRPRRSLPPARPPPLWPPPLSEFPPLEAPSYSSYSSDGEFYDDDDVYEEKKYMPRLWHSVYSSDEEEEDDISPRHYMQSGRKKKKGASLGWFSVKPNAKGLITARLRVAGANFRSSNRDDWEEEEGGDASEGSPLVAGSVETWSAPLLYEFPLLRRAPPPAPRMLPIRRAPCATARRPSSPTPAESPRVNLATPPDPPCSTNDTFAREWRVVRLADLGVDVAASRRFGRHYLPPRKRSAPAAFRRPFATFPGRPSRTMWRR